MKKIDHRARTTNRANGTDGQKGHHVMHLQPGCYFTVTQVSVHPAPVRGSFGSSTRPIGAALHSTLRCTITSFPVSIYLSSPGDVSPTEKLGIDPMAVYGTLYII